jgi:hypothetical protein
MLARRHPRHLRAWAGRAHRGVAPAGITAALENNGSEAIEAALELGVKPARINSIVGNAAQYGVGSIGGGGDPEKLTSLAALVVNGELSIPIEAVFALDDIVAAYERLDTRHLRGKIIVRIGDRASARSRPSTSSDDDPSWSTRVGSRPTGCPAPALLDWLELECPLHQ